MTINTINSASTPSGGSVKGINVKGKAFSLLIFFGALFIILTVRLYFLQIVYSKNFRYDAKKQSRLFDYDKSKANRGQIYDRHFDPESTDYQKPLVANELAFKISIIPQYLNLLSKDDKEKIIEALAGILVKRKIEIDKFVEQTTVGDLKENIYSLIKIDRTKDNPWTPKTLAILKYDKENAPIINYLIENKDRFPMVSCDPEPYRHYELGEKMAHISGYIQQVTKEDIDKNTKLRPYNSIGRRGIEKLSDTLLRGTEGEVWNIRNNVGQIVDNEVVKSPVNGSDLVLTIDRGLQEVAYDALGDQKGAVIVTYPATGEVLALISKPSFNPNYFILNNYYENLIKKEIKDLLLSDDYLFINRATRQHYPPSSIFKLVVTLAALESAKLKDINKEVVCKGVYFIGKKPFRCTHVHGKLNLLEAIQKSCNVYFYTLGTEVGIDLIYDYAHKLRLDEVFGINFSIENKGLVLNREWKKANYEKPEDKKIQPGELLHISIGQGLIGLSPMAIHSIISYIATGGKIYKPQIIKSAINRSNQTFSNYVFKPDLMVDAEISEKTLNILRLATSMVTKPGGTGYYATDRFISRPVAGKTGTGQSAKYEYGVKIDLPDHALFTSYGPIDAPIEEQIAVTVVVENVGGYGGSFAAPVATAIFNKYLDRNAQGEKTSYFNGMSLEETEKRLGLPLSSGFEDNRVKEQLEAIEKDIRKIDLNEYEYKSNLWAQLSTEAMRKTFTSTKSLFENEKINFSNDKILLASLPRQLRDLFNGLSIAGVEAIPPIAMSPTVEGALEGDQPSDLANSATDNMAESPQPNDPSVKISAPPNNTVRPKNNKSTNPSVNTSQNSNTSTEERVPFNDRRFETESSKPNNHRQKTQKEIEAERELAESRRIKLEMENRRIEEIKRQKDAQRIRDEDSKKSPTTIEGIDIKPTDGELETILNNIAKEDQHK